MDQTLSKAACSGDIHTLHRLIEHNPFLLSDIALIHPKENPLTIAIKANQTTFALELLKLNPQLSIELDHDGIRPLHVASSYGNVEIVKGILALGFDACRLKSKDGRTAIHYAAMNGRIEIIGELLMLSPDTLKDVTVYEESALHFAVKCYKFEALRSLLEWSEKLEITEMVNWKDREGNTILHYAACRKQVESIEILGEWNKKSKDKLKMNIVNKKGLTAMDIIDLLSDSSTDITLRNILRRYGACEINKLETSTPELDKIVIEQPPTKNNSSPSEIPKDFKEIRKQLQFQWQRDSPGQATQSLLLVAALVATVTFQAGINPPTYLFQGNGESVDEMQRASYLFSITVFLVANSISLSTALVIVDYLTDTLPFQRELSVSVFFMMFGYGWSMGYTKPTSPVKNGLVVLASVVPFFLRHLPYLLKTTIPYWCRKMKKSHGGVSHE